ncbi:SAM-dependent methyltransferase [Calothrix sp. HK-06]|nr:SAM-dependent methyltransferase [Calothrix sp. HK-06]
MTNSAKQYAPATQRNREAILEVLQQVLPPSGTILEVASGTGEHAVFMAPHLLKHKWLPSDPNPVARASIAAWLNEVESNNIYEPIDIDASLPTWSVETHLENFSPITAIVNINMIHISPWAACLGLMAGANRILPPGGILYMYGPYKQNGKHTAPSNEAFDESLKMQNSEWGVRDLEEVIQAASAQNLSFLKTFQMPANNLSVIFAKLV